MQFFFSFLSLCRLEDESKDSLRFTIEGENLAGDFRGLRRIDFGEEPKKAFYGWLMIGSIGLRFIEPRSPRADLLPLVS
jgi:hypothetical protein